MLHLELTCWKINTLIKANYKQLKAILVLKVKKLDLVYLMLILDKFQFFDSFFKLI